MNLKKLLIILIFALFLLSCNNEYLNEKEEINPFVIKEVGTINLFVNEEIKTKTEYVDGVLFASTKDYKLENKEMKIRLRGNSSLVAPKKSYKIKFDSKENFFNLGDNKEWALVANYYDNSFLRNYYAYSLAKSMEMEYAIDFIFTKVYLNNEYLGLYLLCETVKTGENRIDIEKDYSSLEIDIPFLLELDFKMISESDKDSNGIIDEDYFLLDNSTENGKVYPIATKYQKSYQDITTNQYEMIKTYMSDTYKSIANGNYQDYLDISSMIDYFIVEELFMNVDVDHSSVFMYRKKGGKLCFGPVWDFDISSGNCNYLEMVTNKWFRDINGGNYLLNLILDDYYMRNKLKERLEQLNNKIIPLMFDSFAKNIEFLQPYVYKDVDKWNQLNDKHWPVPSYLVGKTFVEQVKYLEDFLKNHFIFMQGDLTDEMRDINDYVRKAQIDDNIILVDVRTRQEYLDAHIPSSVLYELDNLSLFDLDKDKIIYVYCRSGNRSGIAQKILASKGYNVINIGGITDYKGRIEKGE